MDERGIFPKEITYPWYGLIANYIPAEIQHFQLLIHRQPIKDVFYTFGGDIIPVQVELVEMMLVGEKLLEFECKMIAEKVFVQIEDFEMPE